MKRYIPALLLLCLVAPLRAQVATVEVSRTYDVRLDDIRKPAIPTSVDDSLQRFDVKFDYSIFNRPYNDLYDFTPYESIQLSTVGANRTPFVYSRLGMQYAPGEGIMPAGELYLQTKPKNGFCSGLYGRHQSFFGTLDNVMVADLVNKTSKMQNTVGGDLTYDWSTGELMIDLKYDFDRYGYRTQAPSSSSWTGSGQEVRHANNSFTGSFNLNSAQKEANTVYYDVTLSYRNTSKDYSLALAHEEPEPQNLTESFLNVNGYVGASFDKHRVYVDMNIEYASYGGLHDFQVGVVEFSPIYKLQRKRLDAKLGVKFGSRYGIAGTISEPGLDLAAHSSIFPDVDIRLTLFDKVLWAHAAVTGGNDLNPYSRMLDDCPVVLPSSVMDFGSRPVDATLSLEGVIGGRLGLNLEGNYKIYRNKMIFVPRSDYALIPGLVASYRDVNQFSVQAEVFWQSQELTLGGRLRYADYRDRNDDSVVTEMPAWTGYAFARYNYRERIIAQIECNYRSQTSGPMSMQTYSVPSIVDIDLNANYLINKHFSVFAKVGNLLGKRNQYMPLYLEPGRNFGGGVTINF